MLKALYRSRELDSIGINILQWNTAGSSSVPTTIQKLQPDVATLVNFDGQPLDGYSVHKDGSTRIYFKEDVFEQHEVTQLDNSNLTGTQPKSWCVAHLRHKLHDWSILVIAVHLEPKSIEQRKYVVNMYTEFRAKYDNSVTIVIGGEFNATLDELMNESPDYDNADSQTVWSDFWHVNEDSTPERATDTTTNFVFVMTDKNSYLREIELWDCDVDHSGSTNLSPVGTRIYFNPGLCKTPDTYDFTEYQECLRPRIAQPLDNTTLLLVIDMQNDFIHPGGSFGVRGGDDIIKDIAEVIKEHKGRIALTRDYHPKEHQSFRKNGGTFNSHCVQGTPGAMIVKEIEEACNGKDVAVFFKGFNPVESFGAASYPLSLALRRAKSQMFAGVNATGQGVCLEDDFVLGTGSYTFPGFTFEPSNNDAEFKMHTIAIQQAKCNTVQYNKELKECTSLDAYVEQSGVTRVVVCGLALDFCVIDTALTLRAHFPQLQIEVATNLTRPAFLESKGYLTEASTLLEHANEAKVTFVTLDFLEKAKGFVSVA